MAPTAIILRNKKRATRRQLGKTGQAIGEYTEDALSLAKRTASGLNALRKLINIETKFIDVTSSGAASQAGTVVYLNPVVQGLDISNRVADSLRIQRITFHAEVARGGADAFLRVIIFRDMEQQGVLPTGADLLSDAGGTGAVVSQYNYINNQSRFSILYDEFMPMNNVGQNQAVVNFQANHRGHIRFRGTTAAIGSAAEGSLFVAFVTDTAASQPVYIMNSRVEYTDD